MCLQGLTAHSYPPHIRGLVAPKLVGCMFQKKIEIMLKRFNAKMIALYVHPMSMLKFVWCECTLLQTKREISEYNWVFYSDTLPLHTVPFPVYPGLQTQL